MDIIDLLTEDHDRLRKGLIKIRRSLSNPDLRNRIKAFISTFELHESIEDEILFPGVKDALKNSVSGKSVSGYEKVHEEIWILLDQLMDSLRTMRLEDLQRAFFKFAASADAHFEREERGLFATIEEEVNKDILNELGKRAEKRFARFEGL